MTDETTAIHEAAHAVVNYRTAAFAGGPISIVKGDGVLGSSSDFVSDSSDDNHVEARILSCYAGGHIQRELAPEEGDAGCETDEAIAAGLLAERSWEAREREFRDRSLALVRQQWREIVAVAEELTRLRALDMDEIQLIAEQAAGHPDVDIESYRQVVGDELEAWRRRITTVD
jgi:hypothetical protein